MPPAEATRPRRPTSTRVAPQAAKSFLSSHLTAVLSGLTSRGANSGERVHSGLACRLMPMGRRAVLMLAIDERPHPGHPCRCRAGLKDAPDDKSVRTDDIIVVLPFSPSAAL